MDALKIEPWQKQVKIKFMVVWSYKIYNKIIVKNFRNIKIGQKNYFFYDLGAGNNVVCCFLLLLHIYGKYFFEDFVISFWVKRFLTFLKEVRFQIK